jgi:hypothetical protein
MIQVVLKLVLKSLQREPHNVTRLCTDTKRYALTLEYMHKPIFIVVIVVIISLVVNLSYFSRHFQKLLIRKFFT